PLSAARRLVPRGHTGTPPEPAAKPALTAPRRRHAVFPHPSVTTAAGARIRGDGALPRPSRPRAGLCAPHPSTSRRGLSVSSTIRAGVVTHALGPALPRSRSLVLAPPAPHGAVPRHLPARSRI